jgi:hypothetical protein
LSEKSGAGSKTVDNAGSSFDEIIIPVWDLYSQNVNYHIYHKVNGWSRTKTFYCGSVFSCCKSISVSEMPGVDFILGNWGRLKILFFNRNGQIKCIDAVFMDF